MHRYIPLLGLAALLLPAAAAGQRFDAQVLRAGEIRLETGGEYEGFRTAFFGDGGRRSISADLGGPLTPATFEPLATLFTDLSTFLEASDSVPFPVSENDVFAGDLSARQSWNTRTVPGRFSVGVLPRIELGVSAFVYRTEQFPRRLGLDGGTLGANPDRAGNALLLGQVDPSGGVLGASTVLPLEGSALGAELQRRVFAVTEDSLDLPDEPLNGGEFLAAFGVNPFPYRISEWLPGDVEIDARIQLLRTFDEPYYPADSAALNFRVAALGAVRIGTGETDIIDPAFDWGPQVGHNALRFGGAADLFAGRWVWISAGGTYTRFSAADLRFSASTGVIPVPGQGVQGRRERGAETDLWIVPRFRMNREISFAATLRSQNQGSGTEVIGGTPVAIPSRSRRSIGMMVSFTNLPAYQAGTSDVPIEASIGYLEDFSGSQGAAARRIGFFKVSLLYRAWGDN